MTETLAEKTCTPCRGGIPPLTAGLPEYSSRWAEGRYDRLPALAAELVGMNVAVLVVSTLLGPGKITKRLMIGMSVETHKTSPDFDQQKCSQAKSRIMQALDDIDCDVFIEMDR